MKQLNFWYEFASPYSYFALMRIEALAAKAGVPVSYQPFLVGPIFKDVGWDTSPFKIYEAKGANFFRDIVREAEYYGLPALQILEEFPQRGLLAARVAVLGLEEGWCVEFSKGVYLRQFRDGLPIKEREDVIAVMEDIGLEHAEARFEKAQNERVKQRLFEITDRAREHGIFGAPSFIVGDELFWGNDRLERALEYAQR